MTDARTSSSDDVLAQPDAASATRDRKRLRRLIAESEERFARSGAFDAAELIRVERDARG